MKDQSRRPALPFIAQPLVAYLPDAVRLMPPLMAILEEYTVVSIRRTVLLKKRPRVPPERSTGR
jgi:hypothetical protein